MLLNERIWLLEDVLNWSKRETNKLSHPVKTNTRESAFRWAEVLGEPRNNVSKLREEYRAHDERMVNLHAGAGNHRDFPALWIVERVTGAKPKLIVWILSEVSGFCFHDPIEIDMSSTFLRDYGEYVQAGLSVVAHAIFGFSGTFIVKKTIIGVRDVLGNRIDRAIRMHSIAEGLELVGDLSNVSQHVRQGEAFEMLKRILNEHEEFFDKSMVPRITRLQCVILDNGKSQWVHAAEPHEGQPRIPCGVGVGAALNVARYTARTAMPAHREPKFFLCNFEVSYCADMTSVSCERELLDIRGDVSCLESGKTIKNPHKDPKQQALW